jgi:putative transposase
VSFQGDEARPPGSPGVMTLTCQTHFNTHRPHRALHQASPMRELLDPIDADIKVIRRDRLGGLLHEYAQVA